MTLDPDKIELAQQIADTLQEGIDAGPLALYGKTYTKSDCCEYLIKPLLKKYNIDTFLESLPTNDAKLLKEKCSRLMSCFDETGKFIKTNLPLTTVYRYAKDLMEELRGIGQEGKQDMTAAKQKTMKPGPQRKHSDEKIKLALVSFDEFYSECNDTKLAWSKVAKHYNFVSWSAARQACYRFQQKRNK